jgi:hypothetical protein
MPEIHFSSLSSGWDLFTSELSLDIFSSKKLSLDAQARASGPSHHSFSAL